MRCKGLLVHCMDFRFSARIRKFMQKTKLTENCDVVALAGAAKNLANPAIEAAREILLYQVTLAATLHEITDVYLMNHLDCGAYGRSAAFDSQEDEFRRHSRDFQVAAEMIRDCHTELEIHLLLAERKGGDGTVSHKIPETTPVPYFAPVIVT